MKNRHKLFAFVLTFAISVGYVFAQNAAIKVVYRKGNDLFMIGPDGQPRQLTFDGIPKGDPVWSKDGTTIAFLRKIDKTVALDNLLVIDPETGHMLADIRICPVSPEEMYSVRYIEGIEWPTEDKIAANGSINPSNEQTYVYDIKTGKQSDDYIDDAGGAVFSSDGEHAAYQIGCPHFASNSDCETELDIDYQRVYPAKGVHVTLLSKPAWSEDSAKVAVVAEDYTSKQRSIVVCGLKGDCESTALSTGNPDPDDRFKVQWNGSRVYVTFPNELLPGEQPAKTWSWQHGESQPVLSSPLPDLKINALDTELSIQTKIQKSGGETALKLLKQIRKLGGVEPDFWCQDCALAKLPRQAPKQ